MDEKELAKRLANFSLTDLLQPDPFSPNPSGCTGESVDGQIRIGKVKQTGAPFGLNLDEIGQHTLITGRAGAGKTTLIYIILIQFLKLGVPFWAFDFKQDYRHLAKTGRVLVFDYNTFKFNPLRPPIGVDPHLWMQAFANIFCQVYWLLSGTKAIILEHVNKLFNDYGVFSRKDVYPTLLDLFESLKSHKLTRMYGREAGFVESAQNRVNECLLSFGDMLNYDKGFVIEDLLAKNVVFELEGLVAENQAFLLNIILRYVFQYRMSNNQRGRLQHVFLFDEAKIVYNKTREFTKELGVSEVAQFTSKIREFGEGLIVADQMPTELANSIKANTYAVICMSQSGGPNVLEMSRALGLTLEQEEMLRTLRASKDEQVFEAIVKLSEKWLKPFVITVMPLQFNKDVSDAHVQTFMKPLLAEMNRYLIPRTEYKLIKAAQEEEQSRLESEERKQRLEKAEEKEEVEGNILIRILTNIREHPFVDQKSRIQMLGLAGSSSTTDKYFKELVAKNFVTVHRIGLGKGLSIKVLYEITGKGAEFAKMDKVEISGKGDFPHKFWQHTIKEFYASLGRNAEVEKRFGIKNVDVGFETDNKKTAVEVELTPANLIENIQKDLEAGCDTIIIAVPNKRNIAVYKKRIEYYRKEFLEKIEFKVLTDFLAQQDTSHE